MVYGNALSAFWEKEAQEHIAKKWPHSLNHLINAVGTIRVGTFLKRGGPPGNSPENGRGADSFGFADLEYSVDFNLSLSTVYPYTRTATRGESSPRGTRSSCGTW